MRLIATVAADNNFVFYKQWRGGDVATALSWIVNVDFPDFAAGLLIQRNKKIILRAEEDFAIADGDTTILNKVGVAACNAGPRCRIPILPDHTSGSSVEREDLGTRRNQIHDSIHNDRRGVQILGVVAGLKDPRRGEVLHIASVDLIQSAVPPRELRPAIMRPVGARRSIVLGVQRGC